MSGDQSPPAYHEGRSSELRKPPAVTAQFWFGQHSKPRPGLKSLKSFFGLMCSEATIPSSQSPPLHQSPAWALVAATSGDNSRQALSTTERRRRDVVIKPDTVNPRIYF